MRTFFIGCLVLILAASGATVWLVNHGRDLKNDEMHWGAQLRPSSLATPTTIVDFDWRSNMVQQLAYAKTLGLTTVRYNMEIDPRVVPVTLKIAKEANLETILIVDGPHDFASTTTDFAKLGHDLGNDVAVKYGNMVDIWQLANEVTGSAVHQPTDQGPRIANNYNLFYDQTRYTNVRNYVKAMGLAIRAHYPTAKLMLTGHWVLTDIFPMLEKDGVPFDIVGWDWYSTEGDDPAVRKIDNFPDLNLPQYFTDMGKRFWIAETNQDGGSSNGQLQAQADWFTTFGANVRSNPLVKGVIEHQLPDDANGMLHDETAASLGLVSVVLNKDGSAAYGSPKPAFSTYQQAIANHRFVDNRQLGWLDQLSLTVANQIDRQPQQP